MTTLTLDTTLNEIRAKVQAGRRLSAAEGELLFSPDVDLHAVGELADLVRQSKNGNVVYYNINEHLIRTNVRIYHCPLCAYSCNAGRPRKPTCSATRRFSPAAKRR